MKRINKKAIRVVFGKYLQEQRIQVLQIPYARSLARLNHYDASKMSKIEKGLIDIRFDTLIDIAAIYQLDLKEIFNFEIPSSSTKRTSK